MSKYSAVFFPENEVSTSKRFFFFTSLLDSPTPPTEKSRAANALGETVQNVLAKGVSAIKYQQRGKNEQKTVVEQALNFLNELVKANRDDEIRWVKEHIQNNNNIPKELRNNMTKFLNSGSSDFNYLEFINYLNICLTGFEDYNYNLEYEKSRLKDIQEIYRMIENLSKKRKHSYIEAAKRTIGSKKKDDQRISDSAIMAQMFQLFLTDLIQDQRLNSAHYKKISQSQTLINRVASILDTVYKKIVNSNEYKQKLKDAFSRSQNGAEISNEATAFLIMELANQSRTAINKILDEEQASSSTQPLNNLSNASTDRVVELFMRQVELGSEDTPNISPDAQVYRMLLRQTNSIQKDLEQRQRFKKRILKQMHVTANIAGEKGRKLNTLTGLTHDIITALQPIIDAELQKNNIQGPKRKNLTERARLKESLTLYYKKIIAANEADKEKNKKKGKNEITVTQIADLANKLIQKSNLIATKIHDRSNKMSEFSANSVVRNITSSTVQQEIIPALNKTMDYKKSDIVIFDIGQMEVSTNIPNNFENLAKELVLTLSRVPHTKTELRDLFKKVPYSDKDLRNNADAHLDKQAYKSTEFFFQGETEAHLQEWKRTIQILQEESNKEGEEGRAASLALEQLKNSFRISTSVKSYDKYNNKTGFHGGSLGGTVEHQIENIQHMFQLGGITIQDVDWLIFAVYNSGPHLLGSSIKKDLEHFFSILAVSLMFDDAGEQATYIKNQTENLSDIKPSYLHLFLLNGTYFPLSYILQLTYNSLMKAYGILSTGEASLSSGSQVSIDNPVSPNNIVGLKTDKNTKKRFIDSPQAWFDTFQQNRKSVSLQLTFLAGLLDILEQLDNSLGSIITNAVFT